MVGVAVEVTIRVTVAVETRGGAVTVAAVTTDHAVTMKVDIRAEGVTVAVATDHAVTTKVDTWAGGVTVAVTTDHAVTMKVDVLT